VCTSKTETRNNDDQISIGGGILVGYSKVTSNEDILSNRYGGSQTVIDKARSKPMADQVLKGEKAFVA